MSMYAEIRHTPGYMYDVDVYDSAGWPIHGYGTVTYTRWGARLAAKRRLRRAIKDQAAQSTIKRIEQIEVVRP